MEDEASLILLNCQLTDSQEQKFRSCHFTRESEMFPDDTQSSSSADEASEQATEIVMVTMPESSDDYETPPEHHLSSQNSSNDGQVPATKTAAIDQEMESGGVRDEAMMVVEDSYDLKEKRAVDITKDSDNLEFLEKSPNNDTDLEGNNTLMVDLNDTKQMEVAYTVETNLENLVAAAALKMLKDGAPKVFVEMPMREQEVSKKSTTEVNTSLNKTDDHGDPNHVDLNGKRRLPFSMDWTEEKQDAFIDVLNRACNILKGEGRVEAGGDEDDGDDDFLATAIRRGMTFPRPRWWPPERRLED